MYQRPPIRAVESLRCCQSIPSRVGCKAIPSLGAMPFSLHMRGEDLFTTVESELIFEIASSVSFRLWSRWVAMWPCTQSWRLLNHSQQQYAKFLKMALETKWRSDVSGLTYIETSTLWRQEHNGVLSGSLFSMTDIWPADWNNQVIPIKTRAWLDRSFLFLDISLEFIYLPMQTRALPRLIIAFGQRIVSLISFKQTNMLDINLVIGSKNPTKGFLTIEEVNFLMALVLTADTP